MQIKNIKIAAAYLFISLLWGSTWLAIRIGLESLTPMFSAGLRFFIASIIILIVMKFQGVTLQKDLLSFKLYLVMGFFSFVIPFGLVYWAEQYIASGLASVLFAFFPFMVIIFSRIAFTNQKIGVYKIIGVALAFTGIVIIFSKDITMDLTNDVLGIAAVLVSATMQAAVTVTIKKYGKQLNPLSMNLIPLFIAGVIMLTVGLTLEDSSSLVFDNNAIFSILYLALFGTVFTFTTYYWLMKQINVVILSLTSFITPIIAVFLGWIILDERLSSLHLIGSTLVLIGILFANFRGLLNYYYQRKTAIK